MAIVDPVIVEIILFLICLAFSAFFSSSEVALVSITRAKVHALLSQGRKGADALETLKRSTDNFLITILIGNNIVNVAAASLATTIAIGIYGDVGIGIATGVTVVLMLVFGEIGPKIRLPAHREPRAQRRPAHPLPLKGALPRALDIGPDQPAVCLQARRDRTGRHRGGDQGVDRRR